MNDYRTRLLDPSGDWTTSYIKDAKALVCFNGFSWDWESFGTWMNHQGTCKTEEEARQKASFAVHNLQLLGSDADDIYREYAIALMEQDGLQLDKLRSKLDKVLSLMRAYGS